MKAFVKARELPGTYLPATRPQRIDANPHNAAFEPNKVKKNEKPAPKRYEHWDKTSKARLKRMWKQGMLVSDMARAFRCSDNRVRSKIHRMQAKGEIAKRPLGFKAQRPHCRG